MPSDLTERVAGGVARRRFPRRGGVKITRNAPQCIEQSFGKKPESGLPKASTSEWPFRQPSVVDGHVLTTRVVNGPTHGSRVGWVDTRGAGIGGSAAVVWRVENAKLSASEFAKPVLLLNLFRRRSKARIDDMRVHEARAAAAGVIEAISSASGLNESTSPLPEFRPANQTDCRRLAQMSILPFAGVIARRNSRYRRCLRCPGLAALEPRRQVLGHGIHRDSLLPHVVALAHGHGVVL